MSVKLGANHQFLFPKAMVDADTHTSSLREMAQYPELDALDCWIWPEGNHIAEETAILRDCGKQLNYNIGDRPMDEPCFPASPERARRERAFRLLMREITLALNAGAQKIIFGSGPDVPEDRERAKDRYVELLLQIQKEIPSNVVMAMEPTDRTVDKKFLFGPAKESADFLHRLWEEGFHNIGMLLDMGHIPIMGENLNSAIAGAGDTLVHIHLGNCIVKNQKHPLFGDKHVPWGIPEGEYGEMEAKEFIALLHQVGYLDQPGSTVSFEMRVYDGMSPVESLHRFVRIWLESTKMLSVQK